MFLRLSNPPTSNRSGWLSAGSARPRLVVATVFVLVHLFLSGCATTWKAHELPPILTMVELSRPYTKVGTVEVSRERFGSVDDVSPQDYEWAYRALREEAQKLNADAVILPEVSVAVHSYILFPSSDIKAKGVAIKFQP